MGEDRQIPLKLTLLLKSVYSGISSLQKVFQKYCKIYTEMIAHQLLIQNLFVTFTGKIVGFIPVLHSSTLLVFFTYLFHSLSSLLFPRNNYQTQPTDGLNHTSFPVVFTVFFTAE